MYILMPEISRATQKEMCTVNELTSLDNYKYACAINTLRERDLKNSSALRKALIMEQQAAIKLEKVKIRYLASLNALELSKMRYAKQLVVITDIPYPNAENNRFAKIDYEKDMLERGEYKDYNKALYLLIDAVANKENIKPLIKVQAEYLCLTGASKSIAQYEKALLLFCRFFKNFIKMLDLATNVRKAFVEYKKVKEEVKRIQNWKEYKLLPID